MSDPTTQRLFRRSSRCDAGACVEVSVGDPILVRNSTEPDQIVRFTKEEWRVFVAGVRMGEFGADEATRPDAVGRRRDGAELTSLVDKPYHTLSRQ